MLYLPRNLAGLDQIAAKENPRYAVTCIRIRRYGEDQFAAEATDGRRLVFIHGPGDSAPGTPYAALNPDPNTDQGGPEVLIHRDTWHQAFAWPSRDAAPIALTIGPNYHYLTCQDQHIQGSPQEGRYPDSDSLLRDHAKRLPRAQVNLNPTLLANLLNVVAKFQQGDCRCTVLFYGPEQPIGIVARHDELFLDALVMPLT